MSTILRRRGTEVTRIDEKVLSPDPFNIKRRAYMARLPNRIKHREANKLSKARRKDKEGYEVYSHRSYMATMYSNYRLTESDFQALMNSQQGCCKICSKDFGEIQERAAVDHCHTTGRVRALLCTACNQAIGRLEASSQEHIKQYLSLPAYQIKYSGYTLKASTAILLDLQKGLCKICCTDLSSTKSNVDHDHKTGYIRGLVCIKCNQNIAPYESTMYSKYKTYLDSFSINEGFERPEDSDRWSN